MIMQYASDNIIPVTLELGGKSPNIFFADVAESDDDFLDKALEGFAMFALNQGEVCTCPSRVLVQESLRPVHGESCRAHQEDQEGHPLDPDTMIGAQASNDQLEKILSYLDIGKQEGAKVLTGGKRAKIGWRTRRRLLCRADHLRRQQQDAHLPGGNFRARGFGHEIQERGGSPLDRERHAVRARGRRVDPPHQSRLPLRPRDPGRPVWTNCYHAYPLTRRSAATSNPGSGAKTTR